MAISPKWIKLLSNDKASLVSSLQQSLDSSLHQLGATTTLARLTLPRGNYDAQVLSALIETYQALGWNVHLFQRDGTVSFECTCRLEQEIK